MVRDASKRLAFDIFFDAGTASPGKFSPKNLKKLTWKNKMRIFPGFLVK
jgi:hypothetical protein